MVNGSPARYLSSSRGLRLGDPLSIHHNHRGFMPHMIKRAENSLLRGFVVSNEGLTISHLQYTDNTIILCDVEGMQLHVLHCILRCFEAVSGLKVNLVKSDEVGEVEDI